MIKLNANTRPPALSRVLGYASQTLAHSASSAPLAYTSNLPVAHSASEESYRTQHRFWLNLAMPDQEELNELIASLKRARMFAPTIRTGIKLVYELQQGRGLDLLLGLFPWIEKAILDRHPARDDSEWRELALTLAKQKAQETAPAMRPVVAPLEDDGDDLDLLELKASTAKPNTAANFLNSLKSLDTWQ